MNKANLVVTGAGGQLGKTLQALWPFSSLSDRFNLIPLGREELDICSAKHVAAKLSQLNAKLIVNAAAYTAVDRAEEDREKAFASNEKAVADIAAWAAENQAWLIHVSTDFVFDGAATSPYAPASEASPIGVYGASKLAGEVQVQQLLPAAGTIIRTSWLYSEFGNNFVKTMLRLMSEKTELAVVNDQIGSPSSSHSLAAVIFAMIETGNDSPADYSGVYHWSDGGSISWFDFAQAIQQQGLQQGLLKTEIPLRPIASSDYPTAARRPAYSVLDRSKTLAEFDCPSLNWQQQLAVVIKAIAGIEG